MDKKMRMEIFLTTLVVAFFSYFISSNNILFASLYTCIYLLLLWCYSTSETFYGIVILFTIIAIHGVIVYFLLRIDLNVSFELILVILASLVICMLLSMHESDKIKSKSKK